MNLESTPPTRTRREEIDPADSENDNESIGQYFTTNTIHFSMNSWSTPLRRTRRGEIDPADSENDNESID